MAITRMVYISFGFVATTFIADLILLTLAIASIVVLVVVVVGIHNSSDYCGLIWSAGAAAALGAAFLTTAALGTTFMAAFEVVLRCLEGVLHQLVP